MTTGGDSGVVPCPTTDVEDARTADLDGDGTPETVMVVHPAGTIDYLVSTCASTLNVKTVAFESGNKPLSVIPFDADGDRRDELWIGAPSGSGMCVTLYQLDGTVLEPLELSGCFGGPSQSLGCETIDGTSQLVVYDYRFVGETFIEDSTSMIVTTWVAARRAFARRASADPPRPGRRSKRDRIARVQRPTDHRLRITLLQSSRAAIPIQSPGGSLHRHEAAPWTCAISSARLGPQCSGAWAELGEILLVDIGRLGRSAERHRRRSEPAQIRSDVLEVVRLCASVGVADDTKSEVAVRPRCPPLHHSVLGVMMTR